MDSITFKGSPNFSLTTAEGGLVTLTGYAMTWGQNSSDRGGYVVRLLPGSATPLSNCFAYWGHDANEVLGCTDNGTLRLSNDSIGVKFEVDLPDTQRARDSAVLIARGDVKGMSFRMEKAVAKFVEEGDTLVYEVSSFAYSHVSPVSEPAFIATNVEIAQPPEKFSKQKRGISPDHRRLEQIRITHLKNKVR